MTQHTTRQGSNYIVRSAVEGDASKIIEYSKLLFATTDEVLTVSEEFNMTVEDEKEWITGFNNSPHSLLLVAEYNSEIIGLLSFAAHKKIKASHTGEFGLSVHADWRKQGIGKTLLTELLRWAKANDKIEKVILQVFDTNKKAIRLYQSLGFIEEGRHIKAIKQPMGKYTDIIQMYTWVE